MSKAGHPVSSFERELVEPIKEREVAMAKGSPLGHAHEGRTR